MKKAFSLKDPKIWIPILVALIGGIASIIAATIGIIPLFHTPQRLQQAVFADSPAKKEEPIVLKAPFLVPIYFYPSGWMGDGEQGEKYIRLNTDSMEKSRSGDNNSICIKINYRPGPRGWAGIFWQYPDGNWGDHPGRKIVGAKRITFWAAGGRGGEKVEFKAGGIRDVKKRYHDSFEISLGRVTLTNEWRRYEIPLTGQELSNVIGAFAWVATISANTEGLTFYLDDIRYE